MWSWAAKERSDVEVTQEHRAFRAATGRPGAQARLRSTWLRLCAVSGIVGPVLFTATFLVQEQFRRGEYSPMAEPVSVLVAGPNGWIQQLNFVIFAVLLFAFAVGIALRSSADPIRDHRPGDHRVGWSRSAARGRLPIARGRLRRHLRPNRAALCERSNRLLEHRCRARRAVPPAGAGPRLAQSDQLHHWNGDCPCHHVRGLRSSRQTRRCAASRLLGVAQRATLAVWFPCLSARRPVASAHKTPSPRAVDPAPTL